MFTNLIESSSHRNELKRRGSFFLFTTASYAVLFAVAGVLSIYAYDARLEEPASEITMLSPVDLPQPAATTPKPVAAQREHNSSPAVATRKIAMASVDRPDIVPKTTSVTPNVNLPVPNSGIYRIGNIDADPPTVGGNGNNRGGTPGLFGNGTTPVIDVGAPPPAPVQKPKPRVISKKVLNGEAIALPKPPYPPMAKQIRAQGSVNVQVLVDEKGRVISAKAVSGHPLLIPAAQRAALEARFSPTMLGEQPVKVSGVIIYNFVLQ